MKKALITRGLPGSGKSSLITKTPYGLEGLRLNLDNIRLAFSGVVFQKNGMITPRQDDKRVFAHYEAQLEERMDKGETIVLDNTHLDIKTLKSTIQTLESKGYDILIVDFTQLPLETLIERNAKRPVLERLSEERIKELHANLQPTPEKYKEYVVSYDDPALVQRLNAFLQPVIHDFNAFDKVVHIGDIQGCNTVLSQIKEEWSDKNAYVFVGDLLDRGIENGDVLAWVLSIMNQKNVFFVFGNHEKHLKNWAYDNTIRSHEFNTFTLPQLEEKGITKEQVKQFIQKTHDILVYRHHNESVVVTHAGLYGLPIIENNIVWHMLTSEDCIRSGFYSDDTDALFSASMRQHQLPWKQVHGHRNQLGKSIIADTHSFNLEGSVEFGGSLRVVELEYNVWTPKKYNNTVYKTYRERLKDKEEMFDKLPNPEWMTKDTSSKLSTAFLEQLKMHPGVIMKAMSDNPHIVSVNFTKDVFFNAAWDDIVVKARGLFINIENGDIIARSYDKFFNVGEMEDNSMPDLEHKIQFPLEAFVKENGYLTLIGYDAKTDSLIYTSKSTTSGEFAGWFKTYFEQHYSEEQREQIKRYLRDTDSNMVFEHIDPVNDPHMVDYDSAFCVLLDVFHRSETLEKLPYDDLLKIGKFWKIPVKEKAITFKDYPSFAGYVKKVYANLAYRHKKKDIEGLVLEDASGYCVKLKFPSYSYWKYMRKIKDVIAKHKAAIETDSSAVIIGIRNFDEWLEEQDPEAIKHRSMESLIKQHNAQINKKPRSNNSAIAAALKGLEKVNAQKGNHPLVDAFIDWALTKDSSYLSNNSILTLRKNFDAEVGINNAWLQQSCKLFDPFERKKSTKDDITIDSDGMGL